MKTIGLLGGMSWESTAEYYKIINEEMKFRLGGTHSGKILVNSVDFYEIEILQHQGKWHELAEVMVSESKVLETAGAECLVICTNTMHKLVPSIESALDIPIIHIADTTGKKIQEDGITEIGLLGTRFTMEEDFYKGRLTDNFDLKINIPNDADKEIVHNIIYNELVRGEIKQMSRESYIKVIENLIEMGSKGIVLGCTEIGLLIQPEHCAVPVYDTTKIHALAAVDFALKV